MRIAYVSADRGVPVFGSKGCSVHVQAVVRALRAQGARVELFTPRGEGLPPTGLESVPLHALPAIFPEARALREKRSLAANVALRATLDREGPFDAIYERYSIWSYAGMEAAKDQGIPGLLEVNAPLVDEQAQHRGLVDRATAERVAERVFEAATVLIAVSQEVAAYLKRYRTARGKIHVIPNGVDPSRFPAGLAPSYRHDAETFLIGFVGSLKRWHGLPILLEAFALVRQRLPRAALLIVGDGPERKNLEIEITAKGLQSAVHFTGAVVPEEVPGLLVSLDVAVAPYPPWPNFYFSPLKVFEYMAAGRAIVASRIGQLNELLKDGEDALLCQPGEPAELAQAILRLERDPCLRERLGQTARASAIRNHNWDIAARRILGLAQASPPCQRPVPTFGCVE